jgi:glycerate 2-kinase
MEDTHIIKNKNELATSLLRQKALEIIEAGIRAVLPSRILPARLKFNQETRSLFINGHVHQVKGRVFVIGGGKASGLMAQTLEGLIGSHIIEDGLVIDKAPPAAFQIKKIKTVQAGHPIPDKRGIEAVKEMLGLKYRYSIGDDDTLFCLLSGGASALMPSPAEGISLDDKQTVTALLISSGADIYEINTVRKHLSLIKGGRLAQYFAPATVISLILSDVPGDDLSVIASGPTYPDPSTYADAYSVLEKYHLLKRVPENIESVIIQGCQGKRKDTPESLDNVHNCIIGNNLTALEAMSERARLAGLRPHINTAEQTGETGSVARKRAGEILEGKYEGYNTLLVGGETTPKLPDKHGKGGRNQHYAALTSLLLEKYSQDWVFASVGTDGSDFMPEVSGAIVDNKTLKSYRDKNLDAPAFLKRYDSNTLLSRAGHSLIITGNTYTNVGDIMVYLV